MLVNLSALACLATLTLACMTFLLTCCLPGPPRKPLALGPWFGTSPRPSLADCPGPHPVHSNTSTLSVTRLGQGLGHVLGQGNQAWAVRGAGGQACNWPCTCSSTHLQGPPHQAKGQQQQQRVHVIPVQPALEAPCSCHRTLW